MFLFFQCQKSGAKSPDVRYEGLTHLYVTGTTMKESLVRAFMVKKSNTFQLEYSGK